VFFGYTFFTKKCNQKVYRYKMNTYLCNIGLILVFGITLKWLVTRFVPLSNLEIAIILLLSAGGILLLDGQIEGFEGADCTKSYPIGKCIADALLPKNNVVVITPSVPLILPSKGRSTADCTSDLECNYPLKCCGGQCTYPVMANIDRGLYLPQRVRLCPSSK